MEDFNNADIADLPDLTGDPTVAVQPIDTKQVSPETQSTEADQEPITPAGGEQEPIKDENPEVVADAATEGEGTQAKVEEVDSPDKGVESQTNEGTETIANDDFLNEMSGGRILNSDDFQGLLNHYDELAEAAKTPELLVPEGKARDAFKYAMQFNGTAAAANQSFHHIMSIDADKLTPKELQFEAYMLREENADLIDSPAKAWDYFEAEYGKDFGEVEVDGTDDNSDQILKRKHQIATNGAKSIIEQKQAQFQSETPKEDTEQVLSPEELEVYNSSMDAALNGYDGITLNFSEDGEGMNFALDQMSKQDFQHYVRNPNEWLTDTLTGFIDERGSFNSSGFADFMIMAMNSKEIADLSYKQGMTDANIKREEELRNIQGEPTGGAPPIIHEKTENEVFLEALEGQV